MCLRSAFVRHCIATLRLGSLALAFFFGISCENHTPVDAFRSFPAAGWNRENTLIAPLDTLQVGGRYVLSLHLRLASAPMRYPYTDIVLRVAREWRADSLSVAAVDTLFLPLILENEHIDGRGTSLLQVDFPIDTLTLPTGAVGRFSVAHLMRRDPLQGIRDVGLSLRRLQ